MEAAEYFRALLKQHQQTSRWVFGSRRNFLGGCSCYFLQMALQLREQEVKQAKLGPLFNTLAFN